MADEGLAEKALAILHEKSEKAIKRAKELILQEKFRCEKAKEALRYYASTWNDTTRPGVLALAHEAVGGKLREVVPLQTAMLFIDAAMDIHDDIIDKSTTKASKETLYGKFGEEIALLVGDALLVKGFNYLHKVTEKLPLNRKKAINDVVKKFLFEVTDAHIQESMLKRDKWNVEPAEYFKVLEQKAADIEGHMRIGAIFGGGSAREIEALGIYGKCLGTLLTVRSEIIDIYEADELKNRITYEFPPLPLLYALKNEELRFIVQQLLSSKEIGENEINKLLDVVYSTPQFAFLRRHLEKLEKIAIKSLINISKKEKKNKLTLFIDAALEDL